LSPANPTHYLLAHYLITPIYKTIILSSDIRAANMHKLNWLYRETYAGFREHGSLLALIDSEVHVVGVIAECVLCQVMVDYGEAVI